MNQEMMDVQELLQSLVSDQKTKVMECATRIIPNITDEDILQPNDFPVLENHPHFRYEEGLLEGLNTAYMAFLAWQKDKTIS